MNNKNQSMHAVRMVSRLNFSSIILILMGLNIGFFSCGTPADNEASRMVEATATDSAEMIVLPDTSVVHLNRGSSIRYSKNFEGKERQVNLKGEAFFEVKKNKSKKFTVHAGNTKTTVLGTSFVLRAYENEDDVELTVFEGEVAFVEKDGKKEDVKSLKKAEKIVFNKKKKTYKKQKVKKDNKFNRWLKKLGKEIDKDLKNVGKDLKNFFNN